MFNSHLRDMVMKNIIIQIGLGGQAFIHYLTYITIFHINYHVLDSLCTISTLLGESGWFIKVMAHVQRY